MDGIYNTNGVTTANTILPLERKNSKLYVVNDDFNLLVMLRAILEDAGFSDIEIYNNGIEVINSINSGGRPAIVISDIKMPEIDGFQLAREIKTNADTSVRDISIIFISAFYDDFKSRALAKSIGVSYFFPMPLDQKGFVESVKKILGLLPASAPASETSVENTAVKIKILILEDDIFVSKLLLYTLKDMGLEIRNADTVAVFDDIFHEFKPDICLLDYSLPDGNGSDVLKTVKNFDPRIKAIMMTSGANDKMVDDFIHDGADNFIKKPIDMRQLVNSITEAADILKADFKVNKQIKLKPEYVISNDILGDFFENAPAAMAILDFELNVIKCNREFRELAAGVIEINYNSQIAAAENKMQNMLNISNILSAENLADFKERVVKTGFFEGEKKDLNYVIKNPADNCSYNFKIIINGRMAEQNSHVLYRIIVSMLKCD